MNANDTLEELVARLRAASVSVIPTHRKLSYPVDPDTGEILDDIFFVEGTDAWKALDEFVSLAEERIDEPSRYGADPEPFFVDRLSGGDLLHFESYPGVLSTDGIPDTALEEEPTVLILCFTRQFAFESSRGEQGWLESLTLTIAVPLTPERESDPRMEWGFGGPSALAPDEADRWRARRGAEVPPPAEWPGAREWWSAVQAEPRFQLCRTLTPIRGALEYGEI